MRIFVNEHSSVENNYYKNIEEQCELCSQKSTGERKIKLTVREFTKKKEKEKKLYVLSLRRTY